MSHWNSGGTLFSDKFSFMFRWPILSTLNPRPPQIVRKPHRLSGNNHQFIATTSPFQYTLCYWQNSIQYFSTSPKNLVKSCEIHINPMCFMGKDGKSMKIPQVSAHVLPMSSLQGLPDALDLHRLGWLHRDHHGHHGGEPGAGASAGHRPRGVRCLDSLSWLVVKKHGWLVVSNMNFSFHILWDNPSH